LFNRRLQVLSPALRIVSYGLHDPPPRNGKPRPTS